MAEDNQDQAREMAVEGMRKAKAGNKGEGIELVEEAKRLDHDAIADIAPDSDDASRDDPDLTPPATTVPKSPGRRAEDGVFAQSLVRGS